MKDKRMWDLYILRLSDDSLYTGITKDLDRRIREHRSGHGSIYVKGRLPCKIVYTEEHKTKGKALDREEEIKKWSKKKKEELVCD